MICIFYLSWTCITFKSPNHLSHSLCFTLYTTKKWGYPNVFKTAGIALKSAGIGSKFLSRHFFSRRFKPLAFECGDRSRRFQTLFRRFYYLCQRFWKHRHRLYLCQRSQKRWDRSFKKKKKNSKPYSSGFQSAGIGHFFY